MSLGITEYALCTQVSEESSINERARTSRMNGSQPMRVGLFSFREGRAVRAITGRVWADACLSGGTALPPRVRGARVARESPRSVPW